MLRILSWNVNGMRAALRKGFAEHLQLLDPDVVLLQEIRALPEQLPKAWQDPEGFEVRWHPAEKKGYAGTALWSRTSMDDITTGLGEGDPEGRVVSAWIQGVQVISVYLPSGSSGTEKQVKKEAFMARFAEVMAELVKAPHPVVVGGDLNIAHTEKDIHNPRGNAKNSGFLPHERAWFTELLAQGWSDTLREQVGDVQGPYSWWSNRGRARELDRGWRIDYLLANPAAAAKVTGAGVHRPGGLTVSDHAPIWVDLDLS